MNGSTASAAVVPAPASIDYIETVVRRSGTSFYWAMRFLPPEKRRAMFAVYAFCREVDDIADEPGPIDDKRRALQEWREEIDHLYAGRAAKPVSVALQDPVERFGLRHEDFLAVIDGMEMDAAPRIRIADLPELHLYCDRVACAVGRLSVRIFGVPEPFGDQLSAALGEALQLTNILRDLKEDAARDRLYLPEDLLRAHGIVETADAERALRHPDVMEVCEKIASLALRRFNEAARVASQCDRKRVRPAVIMMQVYRRTFDRLAGRGWRRWAEPVSVSRAEKLWVALRYGFV
ncbi:MAG: presqualene diphosphate synthase HpnD [Rhodospirillales bacterium]|nr:presqualene diphosphate synthase HpnD [Rhodospirillales bacterium]